MLAKNRDGRIIKLEGNPSFPGTGGALCIAGQAASPGPVPSRSLSRGALRGQAPRLGRGREASGRQGRRPREGRPGAEDRAGERARVGIPWASHGRLGPRLRRAAAGGVRGDRVRVPAGSQSRRVRTRRHSALRHRRGGLSPVLRRRFPRDVARRARQFRRLRPDARLRQWPSRHGGAHRAADVHDGRQCRRVGAQCAGHRRRARARHPQGHRGRRVGGGRRVRTGDAPRRGGRRGPRGRGDGVGGARRDDQAAGPRGRGLEERARPRRRRGRDRHECDRDADRDQPPQRGARRLSEARPLRRRFRVRQGQSLRRDAEPDGGDGQGRGGGPDPRRRESGVHDAPQVGLRRGPRQGSTRGEPGQSAQRDGVARGPRLARAPSARVVGGFCRRGRRDRAHAADHGARPDRRQAGGRQVHRRYPAVRRPSGAGRGCGQGPAQVGELRGAGEGRVEEARQGLRGRAALHRLLAGLPRARRRLALRAGRGGGAQGRPAANRAGGRQARRGRIARAPRLPVRALLRRPGRRQAVAAGSAGRHDPDHVGWLGRGPLGDGHQARC